MRTTIVCGLLGSGKTTFIQNFLRDSKEKAVVLVNDFGKAGIDGEIFSSSGIESVELPSGCVCCTLKTDLITTIEKIISTFAPEHLIIEPSGIASPSGVLEALDQLKITPVMVIGIVDATEFSDLYEAEIYGSFFRDQVSNSDVILINKADLADEDKLTKTLILIGNINPCAITFCTVQATLEGPVPALMTGQRSIQRHASHLHFDTGSFRLAKTVGFSLYKRLFEDMKAGLYGNIVRAKSLVVTEQGPFRFDLSYGNIDTSPLASSPGDSRLVVIGDHLEKKALSRAFTTIALHPPA
jgi:G3E family GTPase